MLGQTIANYRLTSLLAQERGTAIYVGEDVRAERAVTIQVWQGERVEEASGTLRHPNIAQVFEAGVWDAAKPYRVMEPLDGETLAARLRVQAGVRVPEALAIAREAARALQAAHAAGIVHGQLTPASVFITLDPTATRGERVKLLDLGVGSATEGGEPRADCRAIGELLFEMLCGFSPSLVEEVEGAVPPPSSLNSDVPEALDRLILAALTREDGQGFGSMSELLRALDALLAPDATPEAEEPAVSSANGTSAFDVPPVELPPAPVPLVMAAPPRRPALSFLFGWQPARMAAGVALVGLGVALSLLARRSHVSRPAGRTPPRSAVTLPSPVPPAPTVQTALPGAAPAVPLEAPPPADLGVVEKACRISIGSRPWAQVWIDGKNTGRHTPILNYKIACGERTLTLRNAQLALSKSVVVTLEPRSRLRKVVRLTEPDVAVAPHRGDSRER